MSVSENLDRLEELNLQISNIASEREEAATAQIINLRQEFAAECGNLLKAFCDDPVLFNDRDLFDGLQDDLGQMRSRLSGHQQHWQSDRIEHDNAVYLAASEKVTAAISDFVRQTRDKLPA